MTWLFLQWWIILYALFTAYKICTCVNAVWEILVSGFRKVGIQSIVSQPKLQTYPGEPCLGWRISLNYRFHSELTTKIIETNKSWIAWICMQTGYPTQIDASILIEKFKYHKISTKHCKWIIIINHRKHWRFKIVSSFWAVSSGYLLPLNLKITFNVNFIIWAVTHSVVQQVTIHLSPKEYIKQVLNNKLAATKSTSCLP